MKIHEYQANELLRKYGVVTPRGFHTVSVDGAVKAAEELGGVVAAEANAAGHTAVTVVVDPVKGSRLSPGQIAAHIALGARLRNYRFDKYKTKDKPEQKLSLTQLTVVLAGPAEARKGDGGFGCGIDCCHGRIRAGASRCRGAAGVHPNRCCVAAPQMRPWHAPMPQRVCSLASIQPWRGARSA